MQSLRPPRGRVHVNDPPPSKFSGGLIQGRLVRHRASGWCHRTGVFRHFSDRRGVNRPLGGFGVGRAERRGTLSAASLAIVIIRIIDTVWFREAIIWNFRNERFYIICAHQAGRVSGTTFCLVCFPLGVMAREKIRFIDRTCVAQE